MRNWTVEDEINLCKWVEDRGFRLCYLPDIEQWGFYHVNKPKEINAGFNKLIELKQHFVNLKGGSKNVQVVSEIEFYEAVERAGLLRKLH